jgi:hypothetical protein
MVAIRFLCGTLAVSAIKNSRPVIVIAERNAGMTARPQDNLASCSRFAPRDGASLSCPTSANSPADPFALRFQGCARGSEAPALGQGRSGFISSDQQLLVATPYQPNP